MAKLICDSWFLFSCDEGGLASNHSLFSATCVFFSNLLRRSCLRASFMLRIWCFLEVEFESLPLPDLAHFTSIHFFVLGDASGIRLSLTRGVVGPFGVVGSS